MPKTLTIRLVGPDGRPVAGAIVGNHGNWSSDKPTKLQVHFWGPTREMLSDEQGRVSVARSTSDTSPFPKADEPYVFSTLGRAIVYAITADHRLVGLKQLSETDTPAAVEVQMEPACRVTNIFSNPATAQKDPHFVVITSVRIQDGDRDSDDFLTCDSTGPQCELLLPAGTYSIDSSGQYGDFRHTSIVHHAVTIQPGQRELTLHTQLELTWEQVHLFDRPAPELVQIKEWKNGDPVKLADLRGKVVLLDFWNGSCLAEMPALMALDDRYKDKGLVIIAIHDNSAQSIAEIDRQDQKVRATLWKGRDLPFLVALDGGPNAKISGKNAIADAATFAAYGVAKFPTHILIDRRGNVIAAPDGERTIEQPVTKALDE